MNDYELIRTGPKATAALAELGLTPAEAASFLDLSERSWRRYAGDEDDVTKETVPAAVGEALRAWLLLHKHGLPWRPGAIPLTTRHATTSAEYRVRSLEVEATLDRVRSRGGPTLPWTVDLRFGVAALGAMTLNFFCLSRARGGFVPQSYSRHDVEPDVSRDWPMLEDGIACIARELKSNKKLELPRIRMTKAKVVQERFVMWDDRSPPAFALVMSADVVLSAADSLSGLLSEGLDYLDARRTGLADIASGLVDLGLGKPTEWGFETIELSAKDLEPLKTRPRG